MSTILHPVRENWEERFSSEDYVYGKEPNEFFKESISKLKPGKILLPAEGEGRNAVFAAQSGWNVDAFDWSNAAKKKADALALETGVEINYTVNDIAEFEPAEASYDAVGLVFVHLEPEMRESFHRKIARVLKPDGKLIFIAYDKTQILKGTGGPKNPDLLYSLAEIAEDFIELEFDLFSKDTVTLSEGSLHKGESDVIKYIGTRTA